MNKTLLSCLFLVSALALADVDDLPPPPGWRSAGPVTPKQPITEPKESGESFSLTDPTGDTTQPGAPELDFQTVSFVRLNDPKSVKLTLTFPSDMPSPAEGLNYRIYVRLDLDQDASTGLSIDGLGAERTLVLTSDSGGKPWRATQGRHSQNDLPYINKMEMLCRGNELVLTFQLPEEHELDEVDVSLTTTINHRVIDRIGKTSTGFKAGS